MRSFYSLCPVDVLVLSNHRPDGDAERIVAAADELDFRASVLNNLDPAEALQSIARWAENASGALALFVLADGSATHVKLRDVFVANAEILETLTAHSSRHTFKLAVFDGCRAIESVQSGPAFPASDEMENALVAYSTAPGDLSFSTRGMSWFISAIADGLENGHGQTVVDVVRQACLAVTVRSMQEGLLQAPIYCAYQGCSEFVIPALHQPER